MIVVAADEGQDLNDISSQEIQIYIKQNVYIGIVP